MQVKTAQIVAIGTELLLGHVVNTNTAYIAEKLSDIGINLFRTSVVGDNEERIVAEIANALEQCDLVITTGGLGPTGDDVTRHAVATFFNLPLEKNQEEEARIEGFFAKRNLLMTSNNYAQALFPHGAEILSNAQGTASGFIVERAGKIVISLPGPPDEVRGIFEGVLASKMQSMTTDGRKIISRTLRFWGLGESKVDSILDDLFQTHSNPSLAYLFNRGEVSVRITALVQGDDVKKITEMDALENEIMQRLGEYCFSKDDRSVDKIVADLLHHLKLRLALAESCTGGMLGQRITAQPGSSEYFDGSLVTYSNEMKINLLDVPSPMLAQYGAVSEECAQAMAQGVIKATGCDISVAITGVAGPEGGTSEKPVGLVYIALSSRDLDKVYQYNFVGGRDKVRQLAAITALHLLRKFLQKEMSC